MYRKQLEKKYGAAARRIAFRRKDYGWQLYSIGLLFNNHMEYKEKLTQDIYMKGFLQNLYLRPSCHDCKFKTLNRLSDITIADFWGIENIVPEFDDKGTSLVLINSYKGKKIFKQLQDKMIMKQVDYIEAVKYNPSVIRSAPINPKRNKFFKNLNSYPENVSELIYKYTKVGFVKKAYGKVRAVLSMVKRKILR